MDKIKPYRYLLILLFVSFYLKGQNCDYSSMDNLRQESTKLLIEDNPSNIALLTMKETLEEVLAACAKEDFEGKELLEYYYLENILILCRKLANIEDQVQYLRKLNQQSKRADNFNDINFEIEQINSDYGNLHIRFENKAAVKEMATLKTEFGDEVTINILPPENAWMDLITSERNRRLNRLHFIKNQSESGKLKVYFDSYNSEEDYFFFVIPHVPYLKKSNVSTNWYAITFDDKKRYRINFAQPGLNEAIQPLIIQPEEGWVLEVSTPEKWGKLSFDNPKLRLKFIDRQTKRRLDVSDFIKIGKDNSIDYYIPSDRNIDIEYPSRGQSLWNTMNKALYGSLPIILFYFIYTGVS